MLERFRLRGFGVSISESVSKESRSSPMPAVSPSSSSLQHTHAHRTHRHRGGVHPKSRNGMSHAESQHNALSNKGKCTRGFPRVELDVHPRESRVGREGGHPPMAAAGQEAHELRTNAMLSISSIASSSVSALALLPAQQQSDRQSDRRTTPAPLNNQDRHFRGQPIAS